MLKHYAATSDPPIVVEREFDTDVFSFTEAGKARQVVGQHLCGQELAEGKREVLSPPSASPTEAWSVYELMCVLEGQGWTCTIADKVKRKAARKEPHTKDAAKVWYAQGDSCSVSRAYLLLLATFESRGCEWVPHFAKESTYACLLNPDREQRPPHKRRKKMVCAVEVGDWDEEPPPPAQPQPRVKRAAPRPGRKAGAGHHKAEPAIAFTDSDSSSSSDRSGSSSRALASSCSASSSSSRPGADSEVVAPPAAPPPPPAFPAPAPLAPRLAPRLPLPPPLPPPLLAPSDVESEAASVISQRSQRSQRLRGPTRGGPSAPSAGRHMEISMPFGIHRLTPKRHRITLADVAIQLTCCIPWHNIKGEAKCTKSVPITPATEGLVTRQLKWFALQGLFADDKKCHKDMWPTIGAANVEQLPSMEELDDAAPYEIPSRDVGGSPSGGLGITACSCLLPH